MQVYKFRNCLLNTIERSVIKEHEHVELRPRTFDVLEYLIANVGKVISKDEILGNVWNGSFVEEGNLPVHISKLRRSLGESKHIRFIETVQGIGYRFVAPVQVVDNRIWESSLPISKPVIPEPKSLHLSYKSIAILPLQNESPDLELDYVADGLTETITNKLALIPELTVIGRNTVFRYKDMDVDPREVGESLEVATVLTGRIRVENNDLVVGVELTEVKGGRTLWSNRFDGQFDEIIRIKEEISAAVADKLRSSAAPPTRSSYPTSTNSSESYKLYLKGKHFVSKRVVDGYNKAIACFEEAIRHDPTNLNAYAELVECYRLLHFVDALPYDYTVAKVRPYVAKLLLSDRPTDVEQLTRARLKLMEWKFDESIDLSAEALALNPNNIEAHFLRANVLTSQSRHPEAIAHLNAILTLDPLSLVTYKRMGRGYYRLGRNETAIEYLQVALEMEPSDFESLALMGATHIELGEYEVGLEYFRRSQKSEHSVEILSMFPYVAGLQGKFDEAREGYQEILATSEDKEKHALKLARIHLVLGEKEEAYHLLEVAFRKHEVDMVSMVYDQRLKTIRNESRFRELALRVGLNPPASLSSAGS